MSSEPSSPAAAPSAEKTSSGNRFDTMFGSDHDSGSEDEVSSRKRNRAAVDEDDDDDLGGEAEKQQDEVLDDDDDLFGEGDEGDAPAPAQEDDFDA